MKASALQEFLRNLGGSLAPVGVPPKSLEDLRSVAQALEPFRDLNLDQLADFLKRAAEFRRTGEVPVVAVPGLKAATDTARSLGEAVQAMEDAEPSRASELEGRITQTRDQLQTALDTLARNFGLAPTFKPDKKWLPGISKRVAARHAAQAAAAAKVKAEEEARAVTQRAVGAFRRLQTEIASPESYQSETVRAAINDFATTDAKVLKAAATELGATGTGTGVKFVESVLVKLTNIDSKLPKPKAPRAPKTAKPAASDEQVEEMTKALQDMVARAKDPKAVSDSEIDAILTRVGAEFSEAQQKKIAEQVTGEKVSGKGKQAAEDATKRLRADLTAVKRLVESQDV